MKTEDCKRSSSGGNNVKFFIQKVTPVKLNDYEIISSEHNSSLLLDEIDPEELNSRFTSQDDEKLTMPKNFLANHKEDFLKPKCIVLCQHPVISKTGSFLNLFWRS